MFALKTAYADEKDCFWKISGTGKDTLYRICSESEGPIMPINIPGYGESESIIAVKDYSENEGTLNFLIGAGLVKRVLRHEQHGYASVPIVELDLEKLKAM